MPDFDRRGSCQHGDCGGFVNSSHAEVRPPFTLSQRMFTLRGRSPHFRQSNVYAATRGGNMPCSSQIDFPDRAVRWVYVGGFIL
jgi:hypothetical protein